jgi:hypothetical protein
VNIILGKERAESMSQKYVVLELDTFKFAETGLIIESYCVVENIPFDEIPESAKQIDLHNLLLEDYRSRSWKECKAKISHLYGKWGGELDTFYDEILKRVEILSKADLPDNWSYIITR